MSALRTVDDGAGAIVYTLTRKKVKNWNLRVKGDGSVHLSVPRNVPPLHADAFVCSRAGFIRSARQRMEELQRTAPHPLPVHYRDGDTLRLLGRDLRLSVAEGKTGAEQTGEVLRLTLPHPEEEARRRTLAEKWLRRRAEEVFRASMERQLPLLEPYGVKEMPGLRLRTMKSRWGSCLPQKRIVTLNTLLVCAPPEQVDYVVLHELCHLVHPDHSAAFHGLMTDLMPDWKERRRALNAAGGT